MNEDKYPERAMGLEPTTFCLESRCSTAELHPRTKHYTKLKLLPQDFLVDPAEENIHRFVKSINT